MTPQAKRLIPLALLLLWTFSAWQSGSASAVSNAPPFESDRRRVLIVHDSSNTSAEFAQVLAEVQAKYTCGSLRAVDSGADLELLPSYQEARAAVPTDQPLPWIVGANRGKGFSTACPQTAEGIYELAEGIKD